MTSPQRILLVSPTIPGSSGVGEIFLRDLCASLPDGSLSIAYFPERSASSLPARTIERPARQRHERGGRMSAIRRHVAFRARRRSDRSLVRDFVAFGEEHEADLVWSILSSPLAYRIAPRVAEQLDVPHVATVWDPPAGVGHHYGLDRMSRAVARRDFRRALGNAKRIGVISERMKADYENEFRKPCIVLRHGIERTAPHLGRDDSDFVIGFCGSLYAESEWRSLLRALEAVDWSIGGRRIRIIFAGSRMPMAVSKRPARIDFLGWRETADVLRAMSQCDVGYLPYWFNRAYEESVRLCFPTKLSTYLAAGIPALYHGPENAAVVDFMKVYDVGWRCHSNDPDHVHATLKEIADSSAETQRAEIHRAIQEELNPQTFVDRFNQLLGLELRNAVTAQAG